MKLRETRIDDHAAVGRVLAGNGLRVPTAAQWQYFWRDTPDDGRLAGIPFGWVLEHDADGIVGTMRNAAFEYEWNQRLVRAVVASAWAVDEKHRRASLQLASVFFKQTGVDLLLNTTAVEETSGKAFLAFGAERIPQPTYTERLLWITGYRGFVSGVLREKGMPAAELAALPASAGLWALEAVAGRNSSLRSASNRVQVVDAFDDRFDRFWDRIRGKRDRLQTVRNRATLTWRFALERAARRPFIVTLAGGYELDGYAVLVRRDDAARRRLEMADLQTVDDDPEKLDTLMTGVLRLAHDHGIHIVALSGQHERKRRALEASKPHHNPTPGWPLYYKAVNPDLRDPLRSPDAWDMSLLDGDRLWSGVLGEESSADFADNAD